MASKVITIAPNEMALPSTCTIAELEEYISLNPSFESEIKQLTGYPDNCEYVRDSNDVIVER